ncbi:unnamed protein product, partial [Chrysoparadoxa australica]
DLNFLGFEEAIAAFLIESDDGPILIETGPHSTYEPLSVQVKKVGYDIKEIKHVLLTHIHLDHAGAAWALARNGAQIYVHPFGAGHLEKPGKLMESARRIYQDKMDMLWGEMNDIPASQIITPDDKEIIDIGGIQLEALYTPGHAKHHIAWKMGKTLFSGDVAGVRIGEGPVVPPCPPPDINLEDWDQSIDRILSSDIQEIYLTHFGITHEIASHFEQLQFILKDWGDWIKERWENGESVEEMTPKFSIYT